MSLFGVSSFSSCSNCALERFDVALIFLMMRYLLRVRVCAFTGVGLCCLCIDEPRSHLRWNLIWPIPTPHADTNLDASRGYPFLGSPICLLVVSLFVSE